jgi:succinate dehydrogenase / fumarate reductase cytochrome b subunit
LRGRWLREVWASTIGKKVIVAITGAILAAWLILHVLGNLKVFEGTGSGTPPVDTYSHWLRTVGSPALPDNGALWIVRAILIVALALHVAGIYALWKRNRAARPAGHRDLPRIQRSLSSRTMMFTGIAVLAFIVFHILQFTTRTIQVTPVYEGTVYQNLYDAFQKWYFVAIYVVAVVLLGFHLRHALWSSVQTLGWDKPNRNAFFRRSATTLAVFIAAGFASAPLAFWIGILPEPPGAQASVSAGSAP